VFTAMVVGVVAIGSVGGAWITLRAWTREADLRRTLVEVLADAPLTDRVMSADAGGFRYLSGHPGIVTPDDPLPVIEDALRRYGIRWLVLERDHLVPALAPILAGETRPDWLSEPLLVVPADPVVGDPADGAEAEAAPLPRAAVHAVCLTPDDTRCAAPS
jgi:hypothetical protein